MLVEFERVRQEPGAYRRLFLDETLSLYVWYDRKGGRLTGFQITYMAGEEQKALTWTETGDYSHDTVDGWDSHYFNKTPLLVRDGAFDRVSIREYLERSMDDVEHGIRELVIGKVAEYPGWPVP